MALLVLCLGGVAESAVAEAPLTLIEAERLALDAEPGQAALLARAEAFESEGVAAGELPDPMLRVGLANFPIDSGSFTAEPMTQAQVGFRQAFPPGRSRALGTRRFDALAREMSETAAARGRDVERAVRQAWLDAVLQERAHALVTESRPLFVDLVTVTRSLYAVGRRDQQDVLRAELELSRLDDRLIEIARQRARARADLGQWVGAAAARPLATERPTWPDPPDLATLRERLARHPMLDAASAQIGARDAAVELARQAYRPGWALDVGYGYRDGEDANGEPRSDFVSVAVSFDLPLFARNRQDRRVAAAVSERAAAEASRDELLRRLSRTLEAEYARFEDVSRRIEIYAARILPQAEDQSRAALLAYQSEAGDFADVMRSAIALLDLKLEHLRLVTERDQSHAVLANLGGLPL